MASVGIEDEDEVAPERAHGAGDNSPVPLFSFICSLEALWEEKKTDDHGRQIFKVKLGQPRNKGGAERASYGSSLSWMRRYSIVALSASRPMGPVAGSLRAASRTSPLQVQWAMPSFTVTSMTFQSCGL